MTTEQNVLKQPPPPLYRWTVLVIVSLAMFGNYYIYDSISPVADLLREQLNFADSDIGLLNAIYSIPNVIMVLIGGFVIDRIGTRISVFLFAFICMLGAVLTVAVGELEIMAAGRLLFGLGAESLIVAVTTVIGRWFKGKELSFAFGINLTIARLGTFAALNSPTWAQMFYDSWRMPLIISVAAGVIAVVAAVVYFGMDRYASNNYKLGEEEEQEKVVFKDIFSFSKSYWLIVMLCVTFYSAIFPFQTFAIKMFQDLHDIGREHAGFLTSLLILSSMILTPLFGLLSDYIGKRSLLMMLGSLLLIPVYVLIVHTNLPLIVPMGIMGLSFSLIPAVMWPSVAIIVPQSKLGTAYGLMTMIQNIGLAGFNLLIGWANDFSGAGADNPEGYQLGMYIFSTLGFFGLLFSILLRRSEMGPGGHGLEKGIKEQQAG